MARKKNVRQRCYIYTRYSTLEQKKGDSFNRQIKNAKKYAKSNGYILDDSSIINDEGVSAYRGDNIKKGALGVFLRKVEKGEIPPSTTLLVESFDRLSRANIFDAQELFLKLIRHGIVIVTLIDDIAYSKKTITDNPYQIYGSLGSMIRANDESKHKSKRLKEAWKSKRRNIHKKKLTSKCPAWLTLDKVNQKFEKNPERCQLIKRIFEMSASGKGAETIAKSFNMENVPAWKSKNGWHKSYIQKILKNRSVLGEFQPYRMKNRKRVKTGKPISNYYPEVISEKLFYKVQARFNCFPKFGGRNGKVTNLFGGLARCGYCGGTMQIVNKGKPPKGYIYLVCDNARRKITDHKGKWVQQCNYISVRYSDIEDRFFDFCSEIDIQELTEADNGTKSKIEAIRESIDVLDGKKVELTNAIDNLSKAIKSAGDDRVREHLTGELSDVLQELDPLKKTKIELDYQLNEALRIQKDTKNHLKNLLDLKNILKSKTGDELIDFRLRIRNEIRKIIDGIIIFPAGLEKKEKNVLMELAQNYHIDWLKYNLPDISDKDLKTEKRQIKDIFFSKEPNRSLRCFSIHFKNGNSRLVVPNIFDKTKFFIMVEEANQEIKLNADPLRMDVILE